MLRFLALLIVGSLAVPVAAQAPADGRATLSWTAPTKRTDGSALTDLAGFKVYYGTAPSALSRSVTLDNPSLRTYVLEGLTPATWYFVATALDSKGVESEFSNMASKTISGAVPSVQPGDTTAYKLRQSVDGVQFVPFGSVPAGTACDAAHDFDGYRPIPRAAVTMASRFDTLPLVAFARCSE